MFCMKTEKMEIPIEKVQVLCERYQVKELALFGSAANEKTHAESDIDFLVEFMPDRKSALSSYQSCKENFPFSLKDLLTWFQKTG